MERAHSETALSRGSTSFTDRFTHAHSSDDVLAHQHSHNGVEDDDTEHRDARDILQQGSGEELADFDALKYAAASARSCASIEGKLVTTAEAPPVDEHESIWNRPEHKLTAFALLLLDEFLGAHQLKSTAHALKDELRERKLCFPAHSTELWCEMYHSCRAALARKSAGATNGTGSTTLEQLLEFCIGSNSGGSVAGSSGRRGFALDLLSNSPASVCASPKKSSKRGGAFSLMDAHIQMMRSPAVRPSRRSSVASAASQEAAASARLTSSESAPVLAATSTESSSTSEVATTSHPLMPSPKACALVSTTAAIAAKKGKKKRKHGAPTPQRPRQHHHPESLYYASDKPHTNGHFGGTHTNVGVHASFKTRTCTPGSYVEPALVLAHEAQLKHELASVRILERELRHIRLEKIAVEPKRALIKRLGFASMSKTECQRQREKLDPYMNDLVLERLGFTKRSDCALCQVSFLQVNLPHKVSFKCIMDVYAKWQYEPPDRGTAGKYRAPLCYDAVHVCRMCAQIVFEHTAAVETLTLESGGTIAASQYNQHQHQQQSTRRAKQSNNDESFCSDPYALPPLFADDCYDERSSARRYDDAHDEHRSVLLVESPAKAIVYANQSNEIFMTSKEWEVISPERSFIRAAVESTVTRNGVSALAAAVSNASRSAGS